jgi:hypothetical protein
MYANFVPVFSRPILGVYPRLLVLVLYKPSRLSDKYSRERTHYIHAPWSGSTII